MNSTEVKHIIERLKKGDKSGFISIIDTHKNMVFGLCLKITQSKEDAEEITQDTFVKVFQQIYSFKGQSKLSTWIYKIAYFTAINHLRGKKVVRTNELSEQIMTTESKPLDLLGSTDQKKFIDMTLKQLTPQERAVISLFYLEENSIKEVAEICGMTISNTKVKVHRTRLKMKNILNSLLLQEVQTLY